MPAGRPPKYETPEQMQNIVDLYFLACKAHQTGNAELLVDLSVEDLWIVNEIDDEIPTVAGLAYTLNLTRQGLIEYSEKDDFSDTVKRAKLRIEKSLEQRLAGGAPAGTIFNLKNNFGWKDKQEQEISGPGGGAQEHKWVIEVHDAKGD